MELEILREVGLSEGEIKVYRALLEIGLGTVNEVHEKTGIERRNIYDILNKLIERGLVTYIEEDKKKSFQLAHPMKIISYLEDKKGQLELTKKKVQKIIPSMIEQFKSEKPKIRAETYRGQEGIKSIWEDMLNYKEICWIGSGRYVPKQFPAFFQHWNKRRIKLKIQWFNLLRNEMKKEVKAMPFETIKFLPQEFSGNPTVTCIYGDKVVQFLFGKNLFAFIIESKELAENYRAYHQYLWEKVAKP